MLKLGVVNQQMDWDRYTENHINIWSDTSKHWRHCISTWLYHFVNLILQCQYRGSWWLAFQQQLRCFLVKAPSFSIQLQKKRSRPSSSTNSSPLSMCSKVICLLFSFFPLDDGLKHDSPDPSLNSLCATSKTTGGRWGSRNAPSYFSQKHSTKQGYWIIYQFASLHLFAFVLLNVFRRQLAILHMKWLFFPCICFCYKSPKPYILITIQLHQSKQQQDVASYC